MPCAIFLFDKQHGGGERIATVLDQAGVEQLGYLAFNLRFLKVWVAVGSNVNWLGRWNKVNMVDVLTWWGKGGGGGEDVYELVKKVVNGGNGVVWLGYGVRGGCR